VVRKERRVTAVGRALPALASQRPAGSARGSAKQIVNLLRSHADNLQHLVTTGGTGGQADVAPTQAQPARDKREQRLVSRLFDGRRSHPNLKLSAVSPCNLCSFGAG